MENSKINYLRDNLSNFRFDLYLAQYRFRNRQYAEEEFTRLIHKILTFSICETGQELIDFAKKIDSEHYEIFTRAAVIDYWEAVAKEIIESNQRSALLDERIASSSSRTIASANGNLRGKRRANNQLEPSTADAKRLNEVFSEVSGIPFTTLTNRLIKNNCMDLSNDSDGSVLFYLPTEKAEALKEKYLKNPKLIKLDHGAIKVLTT
ncbi:hypothetical protein BCV72DRAFT_246066 [Rhizopus microsporus var. microsporus]|uniref:Uncharacterized protein n=1 Tax=Rhizopus microsporus var. microsporus TaxID=86635 RepID=A0A1X0QNF7_RHIZD|nr:hypothetical protein BCV72DRAFT_246066 [Rhizopus microsporus var. microsporus]